jgi:uncharacterized membrane protein
MDDLADRTPDAHRSPPPRFQTHELIAAALVAGTVVATAALYSRLPAQVPVHFDIHAQPDGWLPRSFGAFLLPGFTVALLVFLRVFPRTMRGDARDRLERSPRAAVTLAITSLMCALQLFVLYASVTPNGRLGLGLSLALGASWIVLGQLQPRTRRNPIMGVRTPWTLASDENWSRTHRVAGIAMTAGGVVAMFAGVAGHPAIAIAVVLVSALYPAVYSYFLARHLRGRDA